MSGLVPDKVYLFNTYRLAPARRALCEGDQERPIQTRAFDILLALIERRDRVVSKDELLTLVWPGRVVEEGNLTVHIAALRKLLGTNVIATLSGRGYRFVASVVETSGSGSDPNNGSGVAATAATAATAGNAPPRLLIRLVGRQEDLKRIEAQLERSRLVTIAGAGGIGKSSMAVAVADRMRGRYPDGVWFVELGSLDDPGLLPAAIASALGLQVGGDQILGSIVLLMGRMRSLLVLDGCEHLVGAAAAAAESILRAGPDMTILTTSREPLRAGGESVHRLAPLAVAPAGTDVTAESAEIYSASALFVERARAVNGDFEPGDVQAGEIMEICRRLDGVPLAIELAASSLHALTLAELRLQLDRRFELLTAGRRTALPHQQTLKTTMDWSFGLLSDAEQDLLLRLSVFSGGWTVESATAVARTDPTGDQPIALIASLVDKSMVDADLTDARPRYRMLDSTRYYASEKFASRGVVDARVKLVDWLMQRYRSAEPDWAFIADDEWFARYAPEVENLRGALAWAFGPAGDVARGVELTSCCEHVWTELSHVSELRSWFDLAISNIGPSTPPDVAGRLWLGQCGWLAIGNPQALSASQKAIGCFRAVDNNLDLGRALWRHAYHFVSANDIVAARPFLEEAETLLGQIPPSKALVSCLRASALADARAGEFDASRRSLERALEVAGRLRSRRETALTYGSTAELEFAVGRVDAALAVATNALAALGEARHRSAWVQHIAGTVASYLLAKDDVAQALPLALERLHAARVMGMQFEVVRNFERLGLVAARQGSLPLAAQLFAFSATYHEQRKVLRSFSSDFVYRQLEAELRARLSPLDLSRISSGSSPQSEEALVAEVASLWPQK